MAFSVRSGRDRFSTELLPIHFLMPIIQRQLEHMSLPTTDRYLAHIAPQQVVETMAKREWSP